MVSPVNSIQAPVAAPIIMSSRPVEIDDRLRALHRVAQFEVTQAESYGSPVGVAFEMYDGTIFGGHNISMSNKSMHAEMLGMLAAHQAGYRATDFRRMLELFQDIHHDKEEIFPACPSCWPDMFDLAHPYLQLIVANPKLDIRMVADLKNLFAIPLSQIWPSNLSRTTLKKSNQRPKLPLDPELVGIRKADSYFDEYCRILRVDEAPTG